MSEYQPERDDFGQAVRELFERTPMIVRLGIELGEIKPGDVTARLSLGPDTAQQHGYAHAGALATLADTVCGLAAYSLMGKGESVMSTNINLSLMRPGDSTTILGRGRVVKAGRRIYFTEADLFAVDETGERLIARATAGMVRVTEQGAS